VKDEADRRYGIELYLKEPIVFTACSTNGSASRSPIWCLEPGAASLKRKG
jgi:hypothetical protein